MVFPTQDFPVLDVSCDCERCASREEEFYELPGRCMNCLQRYRLKIRRGDRAPFRAGCPKCGCAMVTV